MGKTRKQKFDPTYFRDRLIDCGMTVTDLHTLLIKEGVKYSLTRLYNFYRGEARPRNAGDLLLFQKILGGNIEDWIKMIDDA